MTDSIPYFVHTCSRNRPPPPPITLPKIPAQKQKLNEIYKKKLLIRGAIVVLRVCSVLSFCCSGDHTHTVLLNNLYIPCRQANNAQQKGRLEKDNAMP